MEGTTTHVQYHRRRVCQPNSRNLPTRCLSSFAARAWPNPPPTDALSEADKQKLLGYLQASHGTAAPERKKITLVKKSTSEIKQADSTGKARTIQVEVRKKRTFVKRDEGGDTAVVEAPEPEVQQPAPLACRRGRTHPPRGRGAPPGRADPPPGRRPGREAPPARRNRSARARSRRSAPPNYAASEDQKKVAGQSAEKAEVEQGSCRRCRPRVAAAQAEAREKAAAESKARADEEAARAADLGERRRKAEAEAAAIRSMMSAPKKVLVAHKPPEKTVAKARAGQACRQGHAAQAGRRHWHRPSGRRRTGAGRCTGRGQGSQVGQAVFQLGGRSGQEEGHPDPRRRHGRRRPQQLARRPAWPPRQRPRPSRRPGASRTGRSARDRSARARNHHGRRAGAQDGRQGLRGDQAR